MPKETIIAKETEKKRNAPVTVLTLVLALAYIALIASYSVLNARLDVQDSYPRNITHPLNINNDKT